MSTHTAHLRLLIVEDSHRDEELMRTELEQAGYTVDSWRVETAEELRAALTEQSWDLVLSDHSVPNLGALAALKLVQECALDLPFIVVCGRSGEDVAVAAMKAGAHDAIMKDDLTRLVPAIERELREAEQRRKLRATEAALRESEERYRTVFEAAPIGMSLVDLDGYILMANGVYQKMVGYTEDELRRLRFMDLTHPDDRQDNLDLFRKAASEARGGYEITKRYIRKHGQVVWGRVTAQLLHDAEGIPAAFIAMVQEIDEEERRLLAIGVHAALLMVGKPGDLEQRARLLGAADALRRTSISNWGGWGRVFSQNVVTLRERIVQESLKAAYEEGRLLSSGEVADLALALLERYSEPVADSQSAQQRSGRQIHLSTRELEVLRLVAEGLSTKEIAERLSVSSSTVTYHLANVFDKLAVHTRASAVAVAMELNLFLAS